MAPFTRLVQVIVPFLRLEICFEFFILLILSKRLIITKIEEISTKTREISTENQQKMLVEISQ